MNKLEETFRGLANNPNLNEGQRKIFSDEIERINAANRGEFDKTELIPIYGLIRAGINWGGDSGRPSMMHIHPIAPAIYQTLCLGVGYAIYSGIDKLLDVISK